jgi:prevent-host-death family protein
MRFASVAEVKNGLSAYLARARKRHEPIVVTHYGKPSGGVTRAGARPA